MQRAYAILSYDWFQLKNEFLGIMIKVKPTFELMEILLRNNNHVKIAITGADARYNGIYSAVAEYPAYVDSQNPVVYLVLYSPWAGYPILKGFVSFLGQDTHVPKYMMAFQSKVGEASACCGPYQLSSNRPNYQNSFVDNSGSYDTVYRAMCRQPV